MPSPSGYSLIDWQPAAAPEEKERARWTGCACSPRSFFFFRAGWGRL